MTGQTPAQAADLKPPSPTFGGYGLVLNEISCDTRLTLTERGLYSVLLSFQRGGDPAIIASNAQIADRGGCSTRTVQRALSHLQDCGIVDRDLREGADCGPNTARTIVLLKVWDKDAKGQMGPGQGTLPCDTGVTPSRHRCHAPHVTGVAPAMTPVSHNELRVESPGNTTLREGGERVLVKDERRGEPEANKPDWDRVKVAVELAEKFFGSKVAQGMQTNATCYPGEWLVAVVKYQRAKILDGSESVPGSFQYLRTILEGWKKIGHPPDGAYVNMLDDGTMPPRSQWKPTPPKPYTPPPNLVVPGPSRKILPAGTSPFRSMIRSPKVLASIGLREDAR